MRSTFIQAKYYFKNVSLILQIYEFLVEHSFFVSSGLKIVLSQPKGRNETAKLFFTSMYREVFSVTEFTYWKAFIVEVGEMYIHDEAI